jgi:hypothetical protein
MHLPRGKLLSMSRLAFSRTLVMQKSYLASPKSICSTARWISESKPGGGRFTGAQGKCVDWSGRRSRTSPRRAGSGSQKQQGGAGRCKTGKLDRELTYPRGMSLPAKKPKSPTRKVPATRSFTSRAFARRYSANDVVIYLHRSGHMCVLLLRLRGQPHCVF